MTKPRTLRSGLLVLAFACRVLAGNLPAPVDIPTGPPGVGPPTDPAYPTFLDIVSSGAPMISAISETTFPGETLIVTGQGLEGAGLKLWAEGHLFAASSLRTSDQRMLAVVPKRSDIDGGPLPQATMLVWPVSAGVAGLPIRVNGATTWWSWPAEVTASEDGALLRVFGKHLTSPLQPPAVAIQPEGGVARKLEGSWGVKEATPYEVVIRLPSDLKTGRHSLWLHNGTGGRFGWSEPIVVTVKSPQPAPTRRFRVEHYRQSSVDLSEAIDAAIGAAQRAGGGTVLFAKRHYRLVKPIRLPANVAITLRGEGEARWDAAGHRPVPGTGTVIEISGGVVAIDMRGPRSQVRDLTLLFAGNAQRAGIRLAAPGQVVRGVTVARLAGRVNSACIESDYAGDASHQIVDCTFFMDFSAVRVTRGTDFVRIARCEMIGHYSIGSGVMSNAVVNWGGNQMIMEGCRIRSSDRSHGRIVNRTCLLYHSSIRNTFISGNRSESVGPHSSVPGIGKNTGEQYLFHQAGEQGGVRRVRLAGSNTLALGPGQLSPRVDGSGDWIVFIAKGRGVGQWRVVKGVADPDTIRLDRPWRVVPDKNSVAMVLQVFRQNAVVNNVINATPDPDQIESDMKSVGVFWYRVAFDNVTAGNTIQNVAVGVALANDFDQPTGWNLVRDNTIIGMKGSAGDAAPSPMFYNEHARGLLDTQRSGIRHWVSVGNVFRGNDCSGSKTAAAVGWLRLDKQAAPQFTADPDHGLIMSVIENNRFDRVMRGVLLSSPAVWTTVRGNRLEGHLLNTLPTQGDVRGAGNPRTIPQGSN